MEKILQPDETGARSLDWRLLMTPGLFVELPEGEEEERDLDSVEEDPEDIILRGDLSVDFVAYVLLGCVHIGVKEASKHKTKLVLEIVAGVV